MVIVTGNRNEELNEARSAFENPPTSYNANAFHFTLPTTIQMNYENQC